MTKKLPRHVQIAPKQLDDKVPEPPEDQFKMLVRLLARQTARELYDQKGLDDTTPRRAE